MWSRLLDIYILPSPYVTVMMSRLIICVVACLLPILGFGQRSPVSGEKETRDSSRSKADYIVIDADRSVFETSNDTLIQRLYGNVRAEQSGTFMYSDSARFSQNKFWAMNEVVLLQGDSVKIFSDSLFFDGDTSMAYLYDQVVLENNDQRLFTDRLVYSSEEQIAYYYDTAILVQQTSRVKSLKGVFDIKNEISYFYHYVTVDDGDFSLRSDSLVYYNTTKRAEFKSPTRIKTGDAEIYCEEGYYDIDDSLGVFKVNAQYVNANTTALADTIYYDGPGGLITMDGHARYYHEGDTAVADYISYDELSGQVILRGNAVYDGLTRDASGEEIRYNERTEAFAVKGRSKLRDKEKVIDADEVVYDKLTGVGQALGNVVYKDTVARSSIRADSLDFRDAEEYVLAIAKEGKPVYSQLMSGDSIHISSDTLKSYMAVDTVIEYIPTDTLSLLDTVWIVVDTVITDSFDVVGRDSVIYERAVRLDTSRYIIADQDVEIYKSDLQAAADSLVYNRVDSIIVLYGAPVMWNDTTQFSGDTIKIFMRNDAIDKIEIIGNAMILSSTDMVYYSQIAGRRIEAFFVESEIDSMVVSGNAQSIYYMADEEGYIAVNQTVCGKIVFLFEAKELSDIKFYNDNESKILPMGTTDHEGIKLDGFDWQLYRRPLSSIDVRT